MTYLQDDRIYLAPQERIIIVSYSSIHSYLFLNFYKPSSDYSWYFVSNVKFFAKVNGFNAILSRFQDEEEDTEGLPLLAIKSLLKAIVKVSLTPKYPLSYINHSTTDS